MGSHGSFNDYKVCHILLEVKDLKNLNFYGGRSPGVAESRNPLFSLMATI